MASQSSKKSSLDAESVETENTQDSASKSSSQLLLPTLPYDVLMIIFKDLLARDLSSAARVCRLWREVATKQLKRRKLITGMSSYQEAFDDCDDESHFHKTLMNKPMLGFFFNVIDVLSPECIRKHLPHPCISMAVHNTGIVSDCNELDERTDNIVYAFLPEDKGVHIECVVATKTEVISLSKKRQPKSQLIANAEQAITDAIKRLKDVKCLILFTSDDLSRPETAVERKIFKDSMKVIWGGAAEQIVVCQNGRVLYDVDWVALMIAGPRVHSWSTVVENGNDEKRIAEKLLQLKEKIQLQTHTLGFMFSCVAKGAKWYNGRKNVESTIFANTFPGIPLIGSFGNGEHGSNSDRSLPSRDRIYHQYSTIFMILTYG